MRLRKRCGRVRAGSRVKYQRAHRVYREENISVAQWAICSSSTPTCRLSVTWNLTFVYRLLIINNANASRQCASCVKRDLDTTQTYFIVFLNVRAEVRFDDADETARVGDNFGVDN